MKLPTPLPFKVDFDHEGLTYTAELYPIPVEKSGMHIENAICAPDEESTYIVEFIPGGRIIRVTLDSIEQANPLDFEESIMRHLNTTSGLRDGNFPADSQMDVDTYTDALIQEFVNQIQSIALTGWMFCRTNMPMALAALEQATPARVIYLSFSPRSLQKAGRLSARIDLFEQQHHRILTAIKEDVIAVGNMVMKYELPVLFQSGTWYETGGIGLKSFTFKPQYEDGQGSHPLFEIYLESGLSPMDKDGVQRCAAVLVRLFLLLEELDSYAAKKGFLTN